MHFALRRLLFTMMGLLMVGLSACQKSSGSSTPDSENGVQATVTIAMIGDLVSVIGGDHVSVETLIGEGVDPHLYKPTSKDIKSLLAADVIFYNGLMLEGKMGDVLVKIATKGKPVHAVTETILNQGDYVISNSDEHYDPHVWMDVQGWSHAIDVISDALTKQDPAHGDYFKAKGEALSTELVALDAYAKTSLSSIPQEQRILITAHDAFGYMARAYGLEVRGIQGLSTESEAAVRDIEDLVSMIVDRKIPAVFVESSVSKKNVQALIEGAAARGHKVVIGGELFSDAMGPAGSYEGTYIGMIDHNVTTITRALGGKAPEGGFKGQLQTP